MSKTPVKFTKSFRNYGKGDVAAFTAEAASDLINVQKVAEPYEKPGAEIVATISADSKEVQAVIASAQSEIETRTAELEDRSAQLDAQEEALKQREADLAARETALKDAAEVDETASEDDADDGDKAGGKPPRQGRKK